nr:MAG TPA: hypothetical protein [Caudoviricetes sp.]
MMTIGSSGRRLGHLKKQTTDNIHRNIHRHLHRHIHSISYILN